MSNQPTSVVVEIKEKKRTSLRRATRHHGARPNNKKGIRGRKGKSRRERTANQTQLSRRPRHNNTSNYPNSYENHGYRNHNNGLRRRRFGRANDPPPQPTPTEEVLDERRLVVVRTVTSKGGMEMYKKVKPELRFQFKQTKPAHKHAVASFLRGEGENLVYLKVKKYIRPDRPLLDVGTGGRYPERCRVNRKQNKWHVHGCESAHDPRTVVKMNQLIEKTGVKPLTDQTRIQSVGNIGGFTHCDCRAEECNHVLDFAAAMFTHSIYYNTPSQVAQILNLTYTKRGFALFHNLKKTNGRFYEYDGTAEGSYHRVFDLITMKVSGNNHTYQHPSVDWILKGGKLDVKFDTVAGPSRGALVWEFLSFDNTEQTLLCQFDLVPRIQPSPKPIIYKPRVLPPSTPLEDDDVRRAVHMHAPDLKIGKICYHEDNGESFCSITGTGQNQTYRTVVIPVELVRKIMQRMVGEEQTADTLNSTLKQARRLCSAAKYKIYNASSLDLISTLPLLIVEIAQLTRKASLPLKRLGTVKSKVQRAVHNRLLNMEGTPPWMIMLVAFLIIGSVTGLSWFMHAMVGTWVVEMGLQVLSHLTLWFLRRAIYLLVILAYKHHWKIGLVDLISTVLDAVKGRSKLMVAFFIVGTAFAGGDEQLPNNDLLFLLVHTILFMITDLYMAKRLRKRIAFLALVPFVIVYYFGVETACVAAVLVYILGFLPTKVVILIIGMFTKISSSKRVVAGYNLTAPILDELVQPENPEYPQGKRGWIRGTIYGGTLLTLFLWVLVFVMLLKPIKAEPIRKLGTWRNFKDAVIYDRIAVPCQGPIPKTEDTLPSFETLLKPEDFPVREGAQLKKDEDIPKISSMPGAKAVGMVFDTAAPCVFSTSQRNMEVSLRSRALAPPPFTVDKEYFRDMALIHDKLLNLHEEDGLPRSTHDSFEFAGQKFCFPNVTWEYYRDRFEKDKINRLNKHKEMFENGQTAIQQLNWGAFVKREKQMIITKEEFTPTRPRTIQGVSDVSKMLAGVWYLAYSYAMKFCWNPLQWIWYCSGYTTEVFNSWINRTMKRFKDPVFVFSDLSKFDQSQGEECIREDNRIATALNFIKDIPYGAQILASQLYGKVFGKGFKARVMGTRKSGGHDTSSNNTRNMFFNIATFLYKWGLGPIKNVFGLSKDKIEEFMADECPSALAGLGDDNFTVIEREALIKTFGSFKNMKELLVKHAQKLGFKLKVLITDNIVEAEFLSCKFFPITETTYAIGKKPGRVLTKIGWFLMKNGTAHRLEDEWKKVLAGMIKSYLPTGNHVPFLRVYLWMMQDYLKDVTPIFTKKWMLQGMELYEATDLTWSAFYDFYGLTESDERKFEQQIRLALKQFGLPCIVSSEYVEHMFMKEQVL